jgi:hypothetical protein
MHHAPRLAGVWLATAMALSCACYDDTSPTATGATAAKSSPAIAPNWVATPHFFSAGLRLGSFAATPSRLLAAPLGDAPSRLVQISADGDAAPFAADFTPAGDAPCYLECAPGVGPFAPSNVFVGCGSEIWQLPEDGSVSLLLATLPLADGPVAGVSFDLVGSFGYDLVVLTSTGTVERVDSQGRVLRVGSFGMGAQGASVASALFGRFAGQYIAAFPAESEVRAMDGGGNVTLVTRWSGVVGAWPVPDDPRAFANTAGGLFLATDAGETYYYALQDFSVHGGELLLTTKYRSGSGIVIPDGGGYRTRPFSRFVGAEVAAGFVRRPTVARIGIDIVPNDPLNVITLGATTLVPVALLSSIGFNPAMLEGGEILLNGARPTPNARGRLATYSDLNHDGVLDLVTQFRVCDLALAPGNWTLELDGTALASDRVCGSDRTLVLAP